MEGPAIQLIPRHKFQSFMNRRAVNGASRGLPRQAAMCGIVRCRPTSRSFLRPARPPQSRVGDDRGWIKPTRPLHGRSRIKKHLLTHGAICVPPKASSRPLTKKGAPKAVAGEMRGCGFLKA
jgi:hypothetical protein